MQENTNQNPEMESVQINQPKTPQAVPQKPSTPATAKPKAPVPPKKIGPEVKKPSKTKFMLGCAGGFIILFVVFIILMVFMMSSAGTDNPVMRAFGLDPAGIKSFLLTVISLAFGSLSTLFFVLLVIGVFKLLGAKKTDKEARSKATKMTLLSLIPLVLIMFIWFVLYNFIGRLSAMEQVVAEVVVTQPEDISNLQAPLDITFSAENAAKALIAQGLDIESMAWDLDGNGQFETPVGANPEVTHSYTRKGTYEVALQVKITGEAENRIYTKLIDIKSATFGADPDNGFAPLLVRFNTEGLIENPTKITSFDWDFDGDGKYDVEGSDNDTAEYTFEQIGTYNVHLRIVDKQNNVENYYRDIKVEESETPLLSAVINAVPDLTGVAPFQIRFDADGSESVNGKIVNYEWDFGDGSDLQSGKNVSHIYDKPGNYTVKLTIEEDSGRTASTTAEVVAKGVSSVPEAKITTNPDFDAETSTLSGIIPFEVDFDASQSTDSDEDIVDYKWDFNGDGASDGEGKKVTQTFDKAGTYDVALTVTDSEQQTSTATIKVQVAEPGVTALINANPEEGTAPLIVQFDGAGSSTFNGEIVSYEWDFGDGSPKTITGATISHKYNEVGNYTVTLKVVTNKNESAETSQIVYVREIPLRACFTPSRRNGDAPLAVTFDPKCSTGAVFKFTWDFGDGSDISDSRKPTHTFEYPGTYTVTLEVADEKNNVSTFTDVIVAQGEITE